jgi:hypothetical protein
MATMQRGIGSPINTARYGGGGGLGVNMASGGGGGGGGPTPAAAMMNARRRDPRWNLMGSKAYNDNQYKLTGHGKTVTEAINEGGNVQAWAPSSGAGPGTDGYRGSYGRGGPNRFRTGRPSASNSGEYYANRDAVLGNPLTMLQLNGPGRFDLINKIRAETNGARQGVDAYYADKALSEGGGNAQQGPVDLGYGTKIEGGKEVPMTAEDLAFSRSQSTETYIPGIGRSTSKPSGAGKIPSEIARMASLGGLGLRSPLQVIQGARRPSPLSPIGPPRNPLSGEGAGFDVVGEVAEEGFEPVKETWDEANAYNVGPRGRSLRRGTLDRIRREIAESSGELRSEFDDTLLGVESAINAGTNRALRPAVSAVERALRWFTPTKR